MTYVIATYAFKFDSLRAWVRDEDMNPLVLPFNHDDQSCDFPDNDVIRCPITSCELMTDL
jgi:hypothetical protein